MAASGEYIATDYVVEYENPSTTWNALTTYVNEDNVSQSRGEAETTGHGTTARTYIAGLVDNTYSFTLFHNNTASIASRPQTLLQTVFTNGTSVNWRIRPLGEATGRPEITFAGFLTSYETDFTSDDQPVTSSVEVRISGAVTYGTQV